MIDKREQILTRLFEIMNTVTDFETHARNRGLMDQDMRPAIILLDGSEVVRTASKTDHIGHPKISVMLLTMRPQIFIVLKFKKPQNDGLGEELNAFRIKVMDAIIQDTDLSAIIGSNGNIVYEGCDTDLESGRMVEGQMQIKLAITYVFVQ